jgi:hypothetical protein
VGGATSDGSGCTDGTRQSSSATVSRSSGLTGTATVKCSASICGQTMTNDNLIVDFGGKCGTQPIVVYICVGLGRYMRQGIYSLVHYVNH